MARAVVISDLHLVYEGTEQEAVERFIQQLHDDPPDELIINGDLFELWRGDLAGVMWLASEFSTSLARLRDKGTKVTYLGGNHDGYLMRHLDDNPMYPFEPQLDYRTVLDGETFFFTHGHKYEPAYLPPGDDLLSITDDHAGNIADWLWDKRPAPENPVENVALTALGPAASFFDPDNMTKNEARRKVIETGIRYNTGDDEWGVVGHTHVPYVDRQDKIANSGSFTGGQATYLVIEDGDVRLVDMFA
jgi:UDP-2,3-diacylglucosamine pyrophosphatase LpxH